MMETHTPEVSIQSFLVLIHGVFSGLVSVDCGFSPGVCHGRYIDRMRGKESREEGQVRDEVLGLPLPSSVLVYIFIGQITCPT